MKINVDETTGYILSTECLERGSVLEAEGKYADAAMWYSKIVDQDEDIDFPVTSFRTHLSEAYFRLGNVHDSLYQKLTSDQEFLAQRAHKVVESGFYTYDLPVTIFLKYQCVQTAEKNYRQALNYYEEMIKGVISGTDNQEAYPVIARIIQINQSIAHCIKISSDIDQIAGTDPVKLRKQKIVDLSHHLEHLKEQLESAKKYCPTKTEDINKQWHELIDTVTNLEADVMISGKADGYLNSES